MEFTLRPLFIFLATLFSISLSFGQIEPRPVVKSGLIEVPEGMHLITDRTGQRWLLPLEMDEPPAKSIEIKYYSTKIKPSVIGKIGSHSVLSSAINALDAVVAKSAEDKMSITQFLPPTLREILTLEKAYNLHAQTSVDLQSLGVFGPAADVTFQLPYIPIPLAEFDFAHLSDYIRPETRATLTFQKDGINYVRYFIHPNYIESYQGLIQKHGIVYHYLAYSTSSPRSLIVIDPEHVELKPLWVKVSLHKKIDGSVRINTDKKARRAIIMSEALNAIPLEQRNAYQLNFMLEPAAFQAPKKISSLIIREVPEEFLKFTPEERWIPAFILQNSETQSLPGLSMKEMAAASHLPADQFVKEKIIRPLLRSYLALGILEGLPGELHTQNFYYHLKKTSGGWVPSGRVMFKDNDGFRYDTELALRRHRNIDFFAKFDEPFIWGKFSNTLGLGSEGVPFLGSWFYKLIRNVNGFETLAAYTMRALIDLDPSGAWEKDKMQKVFDRVAAEEAEKLTGIHLDPADDGFGYDRGINKILNAYRKQKSLQADSSQKSNPLLQEMLAGLWTELKERGRVSTLRRGLGKESYYLLHRSHDDALMIEARSPKAEAKGDDPTIGFAMLESASTEVGSHRAAFLRKILSAVAPSCSTALKKGAP